jgi:hypothetical protein
MEILESIQDIAVRTIGRKLTATDVRLYSVLHNANKAHSVAKNGLFDEDMLVVLRELDKQGHVTYNEATNEVVIKKSFYPYMIWMIENSSR